MNLLGVLEGVLFVVGDEGITLNQICEILSVDMEEAKRLLMELKKEYENARREIGKLIKIYREVTVRHYLREQSVKQIAKSLNEYE